MAIFIPIWLFLHDLTVRGLSRIIFLKFFASGRMKFSTDGLLTPGVTFVYPFLEFTVLLLACWVMSKIERRSLGSYGLPLNVALWKKFLSGLAISFVALSTLIFTIFMFHGVEFTGFETHGVDALRYGVYWAITFLMISFSEEFAFRGYALATLTEGIYFWPAAILLSLIFALLHSGNPGETPLGLFSIFVAGMAFSYFVKTTGDLWFAVGFHAGWDWAQSFLFGVPDSGMVSAGRWLVPAIHGPAWLTGGTAGPEGSVFCVIGMSLTAWAAGKFYMSGNKHIAI